MASQDPVSQLVSLIDPASPYATLQSALDKASGQAQQLSALQWQRQMAGLSRALGYGQQSQDLFNNIYNKPGPAPGATLPQGLSAPTAQATGPGLQAYLGRGK